MPQKRSSADSPKSCTLGTNHPFHARQYKEDDQLRLKALASTVLNGLDYCLKNDVAGLEKKLRNRIANHPDRIFQIVRTDLPLLLEYGLKDLALSFVQKESHLRLLAAELGRILSETHFSTMYSSDQTNESTRFLGQDNELLRDFLDKLGKTKFMLVIQFGERELEESCRTNAEKSLRSFDLWMQRLRDGIPTEHEWFLFEYGTRNLKGFIKTLSKVLRNPKFVESKDEISKKESLKYLYLPKSIFQAGRKEKTMLELEERFRFAVDLWEDWDLLFLYDEHPRGKQPEFYSEILSLVTQLKGSREILPKDEGKVTKRKMTRTGFLIHREVENEP